MISAAFYSSVDVIDRYDPSNEMRYQLQPRLSCIIRLYNSKRCSTRSSLLRRRRALVLKVGVSIDNIYPYLCMVCRVGGK